MRLHLLGINGPYPASGCATSGYFLEAGPALLQFDFGSGILSRLTEICPPEEIDALFLSHWHFDHVSDLLPLIYRLEALGRSLPVYAPLDEESAVWQIANLTGCLMLHNIKPGDIISIKNVEIQVAEARHPVPTIGFRVEYNRKSIGYTGDTNVFPSLTDLYRRVDLLLADGLFPKENWSEGKPHLSAIQAAILARDAEVNQLVITHLNPVYSPSLLLREARAFFPGAQIAKAGAVISL